MTADQLREQARAEDQAAHDSFERCDTDGFVSQWAHGLTAQLHRAQADLLEAGGLWQFDVIVRDDGGAIVPSRVVDTRYGRRRVVLDEHDNALAWAPAYPPESGRTPAVLARLGLSWAMVSHPAVAVMDGKGRGLSGTAWVARKPICAECSAIIRTIGAPCSCGHLTVGEAVA